MNEKITKKITFLIKRGYVPPKEAYITQLDFNDLPKEKQDEYILIDADGYEYAYRKDFFEKVSEAEMSQIDKYSTSENIFAIRKYLKIICGCISFFTVLYVLNLILTIFFTFYGTSLT